MKPLKLKRNLGLFELTLYGVGIILGAGIYALIGVGAGIAGNALWLSFILAALIASFTGLSYAELSSLFPREAAEYVYTKKAFGKQSLSFIISWVIIIGGVAAAATVSLGFGNYFSAIFGTSPILSAFLLIFFLSLINFYGIKESARFNIVATIIEALGLLLVVAVGFIFFLSNGITIDFLETPPETPGLMGIIGALALMFFAYLGFENTANISEEAKNPRKVVPKALLLALAISTVLYILVSVSAVSVLGWEELSQSEAPLTEVIAEVIPGAGILMSFIALFAMSNTVLITLIVMSRILYGVSCQHSLPKCLSNIHKKRRTPYIAVFIVMLFASLPFMISVFVSLVMHIDPIHLLKNLGLFTDVGIFIAYMFVNLSLIAMRFKRPSAKRPFKVPMNIGRFPVIAFLGALSCFMMLSYFAYFKTFLVMLEIIVIFAGVAVYKFYNR